MDRISFTFDGQEVSCAPGSSLAAALTEAGVRGFRETEKGKPRGIFCGMGVCQDCLVSVDGRPNQRACMTATAPGMTVAPQPARPALTAPPAVNRSAHRLTPRVLVVGGGAGGLSAAIAARETGAEVVLLDERKVPGGQYFKQSARPEAAPLDAQQAEGQALVARARDAGVTILPEVTVWGAFDGPEILAADPGAVYAIRPGALIVATGAYERPAMIPGWTLPGVMTVGAAQTLWRSYGTLPGARVALFGNGPLVAQVALELAEGGAEIPLLGESAPAPWRRPLASLAMMRRDPGLARKGLSMLAGLKRQGIAPRHDLRPTRIEAAPAGGLLVHYEQGRHSGRITADAVCLNYGFQPQNEILRLLDCAMTYDARFDQLRPERAPDCRTSIAGVYAVGDCCGLGGAPAAALEGRIAGRAAAGGPGPSAGEAATLARHRAFQDALWRVYDSPAPPLEEAAPETLVCRCEEVEKAALDAALSDDPHDIGALKRATRIGMGRCQGRYCAPALAGLMARRRGTPMGDLSYFAPRVPIKPVDIATITAAEALLAEETNG
ncbi:2Fe-2S iron-sulfur cluster-binding protein [Roseivivax sp. GX 12232]|uniref:2Fe-2S iron-sulfur cluster-binding protein n=1 Tax=Roseivivax sp. GX 12232 TaxID=2900547 RepID=UPI001E49CB14|nr:2Fe-2S iron-sulfur cluster-binding protein [Roseivivax sp. GX 12232]